jgi:hypothetical protein
MPVAQTFVLRRVLKGGISTDRCLVARAGCEYGCFLFLRGGWCSGKRAGAGCWVVFGTLLGPEATGPRVLPPFVGWGLRVCLFLVSWLHRSCTYVCGVCGLGLLFENYIVDASIFYKKQFPRI